MLGMKGHSIANAIRPERLGIRFEDDEAARAGSGFANSTYKTIFDRLEDEGSTGKRVFIKDILYYLLPPDGKAPQIAPSLTVTKRGIGTSGDQANGTNGVDGTNGVNGDQPTTNGANGHQKPPFPYNTYAEPSNPTVVPQSLLEKFHFTFLIRDPHSSIPSYFRCTIPPLVEMTGFYDYYPNEAGYDELRRFFDYMRESGQVGPTIAGESDTKQTNGAVTNGTKPNNVDICVVDADDLLDDPEGIIRAYCTTTGLDYTPDMLNWDNDEDQTRAKAAFEKWKGFHEDAIDSKDLKPRTHVSRAKPYPPRHCM
jgi:hypothetical protein